MKKEIGEIMVAGFLGITIIGISTGAFMLNRENAPEISAKAESEGNTPVETIGQLSSYYSMKSSGFTVQSTNYNENQAPVFDVYLDDDYIIPFSDKRYLTSYDLIGFDQTALKYARNEIYARHGRKFKDEGLQSYFDNMSWYIPIYEPDEFPDELLSEVEKENALFIGNLEN